MAKHKGHAMSFEQSENANPGLSKVAGYRRKSPPTWLVSACYSAWHFFTDGLFLNKISLDWLLTLTTQPSTSKLFDNRVIRNTMLLLQKYGEEWQRIIIIILIIIIIIIIIIIMIMIILCINLVIIIFGVYSIKRLPKFKLQKNLQRLQLCNLRHLVNTSTSLEIPEISNLQSL